MVAHKQDTALIRDCKVECRENHYTVKLYRTFPDSVLV